MLKLFLKNLSLVYKLMDRKQLPFWPATVSPGPSWLLDARKQIETGALSPTFVRPKMEVLRLYKVALPVRITYDMTSPTLGTGTGLFFFPRCGF